MKSTSVVRHFEHLLDGITDSTRPPAALNYVLFNTQNQIVASGSGAVQVNGDGAWGIIGTDGPIIIPENGYLSVFLTNRSVLTAVHFDDLRVILTRGKLREEHHYYPHGLPMGHIGSSSTAVENRQKHQGNEYIQDLNLNWMDFQARQYDPQIGRFLGVDPLAEYYGQDRYSPYAAMGNQPESMIDPEGLVATISKASGGGEPQFGGLSPGSLAFLHNGNTNHNFWADQGGGGGGSWQGNGGGAVYNFQGLAAKLFLAGIQKMWGGGGSSTTEEVVVNNVAEEGPHSTEPNEQPNDGGQNGDPEKEGKFGTYKVWDRAGGYDKKLSKEEADLWYLWGNGQPIYVDNSYIDWSGLSIPEGLKKGDRFAISTVDAFLWLPYETAATYGGTSFEVVDANTVKVLDQEYHYRYRDNNSAGNIMRNFMTWWGEPSYEAQGKPYMIHYYNREIKIK